VNYAAVGASDALGVGSSRPCLPLTPCSDGAGYVALVARHLSSGRAVTLTNLGVPGAVLGPDTQALGRRFGRDIVANFIDNLAPFVPRDATLVTVFAGGNDVNALVAAAEAGAAASTGVFVDEQVRQFASDLTRLIRAIRDRTPSARIVAANLPNMALLPYARSYGADRRQLMRQLSAGFTLNGANALAGQGVVVVDLACDARSYDSGNYSSDGFHPNDRGYAFMADMMIAGITGASPPGPRGSCPELERF
jgi:lysophospholipase L1-like esterase